MDRDDMFDTGATVATAAGIRQARRKFFRKVYRTLYSGVPKRIGPVIALGSILNRFAKTAADEASQAPNPLNTPFAHRLYAGGAVASGAALGVGNRILNQATKPTTAYVKYAIGDARGAKKSYDLASDLIANREKAVDYLKKNPGPFSSSYGEAINYNLNHLKTQQQQYLKEYNVARKAVGDNFKAYQNARKNYKIMSQKGKMLRSIGKAGLAASIVPAALGYFMDRNTKTASSDLPTLYRLKQSINKKEKTAGILDSLSKIKYRYNTASTSKATAIKNYHENLFNEDMLKDMIRQYRQRHSTIYNPNTRYGQRAKLYGEIISADEGPKLRKQVNRLATELRFTRGQQPQLKELAEKVDSPLYVAKKTLNI